MELEKLDARNYPTVLFYSNSASLSHAIQTQIIGTQINRRWCADARSRALSEEAPKIVVILCCSNESYGERKLCFEGSVSADQLNFAKFSASGSTALMIDHIRGLAVTRFGYNLYR